MTEATQKKVPDAVRAELRRDIINLRRDGYTDDQLSAYAKAFIDGFDTNEAGALDIGGQFAQGALLNFGDEIYGAARSLFSDKSRIEETAGVRGAMANAREEYPIASTIAQVGGGVSTAFIPGVGLARGVATGGSLARAAGAGAAIGAAQGAIAGGGAGSGSITQRGDEAAQGALIGGALGGAAAPAGRIASSAIKAGRQALTKKGGQVAADAAVRKSLGEAGKSVDDVAREMSEAQAAGVPLTTGEAIGRQGVAGLEDIANTANPAQAAVREALETRQLAQPGRIRQNLINETGSDMNAVAAAERAVAARSVAAGPRYEALNGSVLPPQINQRFADLTGTQAGRRAYKSARSNSVMDNLRDPTTPVLPSLDELAEGAPLTVRQADYVIRGLGDEAVRAGRKGLNSSNFSRNRLAQELQSEVDNFDPLYREAREAWAGPSAFKDAVEGGKKYLSQDIDTFKTAYAKAGDAERQGIRLGLLSAVKSKLEKAVAGPTTNAARQVDKGLDLDAKLQAVLTPAEYANIRRMVDLENFASRSNTQIVGNSATARRFLAADAVSNEALDAVSAAADPQLGTIQGVLNGIRDRLASNQREALAPILMEQNPDMARMLLQRAMGNAPRFEGTRAPAIGGAIGGGVSSAQSDRRF